jgi:hypothetical protein
MRGARSSCELALDIIADRHERHRKRPQRVAHVDGIAVYAAELQGGEGLVQRIRLRRELRPERCLGDIFERFEARNGAAAGVASNASINTVCDNPSAWPNTIPSANAAMALPINRFTTIFMAVPVPWPPV